MDPEGQYVGRCTGIRGSNADDLYRGKGKHKMGNG